MPGAKVPEMLHGQDVRNMYGAKHGRPRSSPYIVLGKSTDGAFLKCRGVCMYKFKRRVALICIDIVMLVLFILIAVNVIPVINANQSYSPQFTWITTGVIFLSLLTVSFMLKDKTSSRLEHSALFTKETALLTEFIDRLRICYSLDDFYDAIAQILEQEGDCAVLYTDTEKNYVLYNSPDRLSTAKETMETLSNNFPDTWGEGCFFIDSKLGLLESSSNARGFFLSNNHHHFYVFCRYTRLFDSSIYKQLLEEFTRFQNRTTTIANLSEIASLSKEWSQLADTQRSFLPQQMPKNEKLSIAAYFRPLVNVSGDYYSVLPIDENKTLLMLGDVSGKGLAAALVMGLVMNTVKILENKNDLPAMIHAIDKAIRGMKLQDKYTVLFLGIVDTKQMTIRYINASMSDPVIITRAPDGYRIKPLTSNCSIVGIIDLFDIEVSEQRLFRGDVILMASDGVSEVMDENGIELGDTELYSNTIRKSAAKSPKEFIDDVVNLVLTYNGEKKLRDDVTMMVAKLEG